MRTSTYNLFLLKIRDHHGSRGKESVRTFQVVDDAKETWLVQTAQSSFTCELTCYDIMYKTCMDQYRKILVQWSKWSGSPTRLKRKWPQMASDIGYVSFPPFRDNSWFNRWNSSRHTRIRHTTVLVSINRLDEFYFLVLLFVCLLVLRTRWKLKKIVVCG